MTPAGPQERAMAGRAAGRRTAATSDAAIAAPPARTKAEAGPARSTSAPPAAPRSPTLAGAEPFVTKDGSSIKELAGLVSLPARRQSLAEATVPPRGETEEHYHRITEELYLFTGGMGRMRLANEERAVRAGDCVVIPPGTPHKLFNDADEPLVLLCCCSPAYTHEDTELTGR